MFYFLLGYDFFQPKMSQTSCDEIFALFVPQECGPLDSEAMVMGVLDQSFDVLVLRYRVQKRIYCKVASCSIGEMRFY